MMRASLISLLLLSFVVEGCAQVVRNSFYQPNGRIETVLPGLPANGQTISVISGDGVPLTGMFWQGAPGKPVIVFFQGRTGSLAEASAYAAPLHVEGYSLLVASYRGYSGNLGKPNEAGLMLDGAAFVEAASVYCRGCPTVLVGHSLGASVALNAAKNNKAVDSVVALGAFTDLKSAFPKGIRSFVAERYSNIDIVKQLNRPVIFLRGRNDDIVSQGQAEALLSVAPKGSILLVLDKEDHRPSMQAVAPLIALAGAAISGTMEPLVTVARRDGFAIFGNNQATGEQR
jgi:uncharacterized protein